MLNFKEIDIGKLLNQLVTEQEISIARVCNFMKCTEKEVEEMYNMKSLDTEVLLKWSKLLEYDFFRLYSQHLILYAPIGKKTYTEDEENNNKSSLPRFRKNVYTKEVIDYILNKIETGEMKTTEVIERYHIPKTTLYKWISKYKKSTK
ncbi:transposase [Empedobacter tilapiae]|uniref:Transposase n=1 Tax=Empedobacter tilapiae TaxID=2491114 RepID=A0A4Z1AS99_9FLAO|nr:transposase [Empedobacter tilapiae]TGN21433.1 transposase [Empedobacter tilapiae]